MLNIKEEFIKENMMGPNSMIIIDELLKNNDLKTVMKVLDLWCGKGLTSIYLAPKYNIKVYAVDLWISATENYNRFKDLGLEIGKYLKNPIFNEMKCFDEAWKSWLKCDNPYVLEDKKMIETDNGRYMNSISVIGNV